MNKDFKYIPKDQRKKILLISDDLRVSSGVANIAKELIINTSQHFNWVQLAGAIKHPDKGKRFDLSDDTNKQNGLEDSSVILYPTDGYGNPGLLRQLIKMEKPDVIFIITDPRYFEWLFRMEGEIRKEIPICYLNIWDSLPSPHYNKAFYESCDLLLPISKNTEFINRDVLGEISNYKQIHYTPHGLNHNIFTPLDLTSEPMRELRKNIFGDKEVDFVMFFNSRNIRRKQIPDTMMAFRMFLDNLPKEKADKCAFILHTEVNCDHGTDLEAVRELLFEENYPTSIYFSTNKVSPVELNMLYNLADVQILLTSNEGWGLTLTESMLAGTPIIANVTGGMQDQMRFEDDNGEWFTPSSEIPSNHTGKYNKHGKWAFPVFPSNMSLQGSPTTPYIWDDRCTSEDAALQIMKVYNLSPEDRKERGLEGRKWAVGDEAGFTSIKMSNRIIKSIDNLLNEWKPREKYELIDTSIENKNIQKHKLIY